MKQQREKQLKKAWKMITVWLLMFMLAVTMCVPTASFASGDSGDKEKKSSRKSQENSEETKY